MERRNWTEDEIIIALALYYQIPFGKIHKANPLIIKVAEKLHRTPSALGMKMGNLARFDPTLRERNVSGLPNGGRLDREIWDKYYDAYDILADRYNAFMGGELGMEPDEAYAETGAEPTIHEAGAREQTVQARVGQNYFRNAVLSAYEKRCCMTGISIPEFLIASHIEPWKASDDKKEKANPRNGLCLNALHDKAFDLGFITVDKNTLRIVVAEALKNFSKLDETTKNWIVACEGESIILPHRSTPDKLFLEYHNDVVFRG